MPGLRHRRPRPLRRAARLAQRPGDRPAADACSSPALSPPATPRSTTTPRATPPRRPPPRRRAGRHAATRAPRPRRPTTPPVTATAQDDLPKVTSGHVAAPASRRPPTPVATRPRRRTTHVARRRDQRRPTHGRRQTPTPSTTHAEPAPQPIELADDGAATVYDPLAVRADAGDPARRSTAHVDGVGRRAVPRRPQLGVGYLVRPGQGAGHPGTRLQTSDARLQGRDLRDRRGDAAAVRSPTRAGRTSRDSSDVKADGQTHRPRRRHEQVPHAAAVVHRAAVGRRRASASRPSCACVG